MANHVSGVTEDQILLATGSKPSLQTRSVWNPVSPPHLRHRCPRTPTTCPHQVGAQPSHLHRATVPQEHGHWRSHTQHPGVGHQRWPSWHTPKSVSEGMYVMTSPKHLLPGSMYPWLRLPMNQSKDLSFKPFLRALNFRYPLHRYHKITAWQGLEGTSVGHLVQAPAQAGSPRAGCTGPHPAGVGISPEKETPQPLWAAWARALSPSEGRSSSLCSGGTSLASVCMSIVCPAHTQATKHRTEGRIKQTCNPKADIPPLTWTLSLVSQQGLSSKLSSQFYST